MERKKTIQELTIADEFMFGAVMEKPENCKGLLELILGIEIEHIEVSKEKTMIYNPKYKGIRLDIYANDEQNSRYNVEMQAVRKPALLKRSRYYLSEIDMELLLAGEPYAMLPNTYVIFICDFDPYGQKKYCYTREQICKEVPGLSMEDGTHVIFLSTEGENVEEVPEQLVKFLKYVKSPLEESEQFFDDTYVLQLQNTIRQIKDSREMGARYMTFEQLLREEREESREEGREEGITIGIPMGKGQVIVDFLREKGNITEELKNRIMKETDSEVLKKWIKLALTTDSIQQFENNM